MNEFELKRQSLQHDLDSQKTLQERNKLGQYSTPYKLASEICRNLRFYFGDTIESVLEPAIGTGVFYSALQEQFAVKKCVGYEIDEHYYVPSSSLWKDTNLKIYNQDFLSASVDDYFSLIISNPPYSRHHHIPSETKKALSKQIFENYGIEISGLSGLYVYFVILSTKWLKKGGYSCWLIPSEFLTVNYGSALKKFLLENVDLISIHSFTAEDVQFNDALVSSSIVIFKNANPSSEKIKFSWGGTLENPKSQIQINKSQVDFNEKWNETFLREEIEVDKFDIDVRLGNYFNIKRGVATGDNKFFIVDSDTARNYNIPKQFLIPIAPSPRYLKSNVYSVEQHEKESYYLFSCDLPIDIVKDKYDDLYNYLNWGINNQVNIRSNCKNREIWYNCESRDVSPILVSYMGRNNGNSPIRFILNEAKVIATNSYLMLYPKTEYQYLFRNPEFTKEIWNILSGIPKDVLIAYGRVYGGGLLKWEPRELAMIPCPQLKTVLKPINRSLFE